MHSGILFALSLTRLTAATFYNGGKDGSGYFYEGAYGENIPAGIPDISPFRYGAANPNATNSVDVHGFTWRANVSQVSVSDATTVLPNATAILDAHVISTVFDLTWPGNSSIGGALQSQGVVAPFGCIMMIDGLGLSENVTSKYTAADDGTCTNVLGDDCVGDFLAGITTVDGQECPLLPSPSDLPASCAGTLGTVKTSFNGLVEDLETLQEGLQSGQGFGHILSSAYNGSDVMAALQEAESRLQILVIKGLNVMACQKVNSTLTVAVAPTPAGAAPSPTTTNAAHLGKRVSYSTLGLGILGALLFP